jgi:glycine/D-amino acid oxidase-like deaminating enzyme/nitrite reductase/ring-hydroxylating ferredoxin subunit
MKTDPLWTEAETETFPAIRSSPKVDVVVIGGGITGLTAAYLLKQAGKRVCVLERSRVGGGETGHTSAHLTYVTDLQISELASTFGDDAARLTWQAGEAAIDLIEQVVQELEIDCGFQRVPGFVYAALHGDKDESHSLRVDADKAAELGFDVVFRPSGPILGKPAVSFANQAIFHPLRYLSALATAVQGDGSLVCENSEVTAIESNPTVVVVGNHRIECDDLVVGTHVPMMAKTGLVGATLFQTKLYPYSSYVVGAKIPKGTLAAGLYSDTSDPYYYLRIHSEGDHDYAVFGGEDHKTGQVDDTAGCFDRLIQTLHEILPEAKVDHRWSGQVVETNDGLPFIGVTAEGQFDGTGYSGNGLTFGTVAGLMACDAALGRPNPWQKLFAPTRKSVRGGLWDYLTENMDYPRYLVSGWLKRSPVKSVRGIKNGEGAVLTQKGKPVACSRNERGELTKVSAICTHMGCLVRWNQAEQTWDCPCHGSRFLPDGEVIGGPAETPLARP